MCPDRRLGLRCRGRRRSPNHSGESPGKSARFVAFCLPPTPASDQHRCRRLPGPPGFSQGAFRRLRRRRPGRITGVIGSAPSSFLVGCTARRLALPITCYYTEGRGAVAGDLRGVAPPLRLSTHAGGKPPTPPPHLNLHNTAGPARRRDDHDETTTRRTASQLPPYPCRRLHGSSLARSGAAIPSDSTNATPCYPQDSTEDQLQARQDAGQAGTGACVCFCAHPLRHRRRSDRAHNPAHVCSCSGSEAGAGHASPSSPDGGRRDRYHSSKRRRRIAPGPRRRRAQIRTQSRSEPRTSRSGTTTHPQTPFHGTRSRQRPQERPWTPAGPQEQPRRRLLGTSPADVLRLQLRLFL